MHLEKERPVTQGSIQRTDTYNDTPSQPQPEHPTMAGLPETWPQVLGYNKLLPKEGAEVVAMVREDPLVVLGQYGEGRVCAYATDCAPHWSPEAFCNWEGYPVLWNNLLTWLTEK